MDNSGFYKNENGHILFAPDSVGGADYALYREEKDSYTYPVDGWTWHDSLDGLVAALKPTDTEGYIAKMEKRHAAELAALKPDYVVPTVASRVREALEYALTTEELIIFEPVLKPLTTNLDTISVELTLEDNNIRRI